MRALIVGDSVRESLKTISRKRLGEVDFAVQSPRFFREELVQEIAEDPEFQKSFEAIAPALSLTAGTTASRQGTASPCEPSRILGR